MLLALDVGNTNVTIGVFKRKEIIEVFRITTKLPRTSDEFGILISNLLKEKGLDVIREHARDFIAKREVPAVIPNDGKQTPMRGHPVFVAQHATATCCRECIRKWHKIQPGKELSQVQKEYLVDVIMTWIEKELSHYDSQM